MRMLYCFLIRMCSYLEGGECNVAAKCYVTTMVDIGGHWLTLVDIGGHWLTLSDIDGHWLTLSDNVRHCLVVSQQSQVTSISIYSVHSSHGKYRLFLKQKALLH